MLLSQATTRKESFLQPILGVALIMVLIFFAVYLGGLKENLPLYLFAGVVLGYILHGSKRGL